MLIYFLIMLIEFLLNVGIVKNLFLYVFLFINGGGARGRGEKMSIIASVVVQGVSSKQAILKPGPGLRLLLPVVVVVVGTTCSSVAFVLIIAAAAA